MGGYKYIKRPALGYHIISASTWSNQLAQTKHYLSTVERQKIDDFINTLEDLTETIPGQTPYILLQVYINRKSIHDYI